MSNTTLIAAIVGAVSGIGAATVTNLFLQPAPSTKTAMGVEVSRPVDATTAGASAELLSRFDSLEMRLANVEASAGAERVSAQAIDPTAFADLQAMVEALANGESPGAAKVPTTTIFKDRVASAMDLIEEEERQERDRERAVRRDEQMEDRLAEMQSDLGLDGTQLVKMRETLQQGSIARDELRDKMRSGDVDRGEIRGLFGELRDSTNTSVQGFLSADQYTKYSEGENDNPGGGGGRGNRGGGQGGGGGGGGF